MEYTKDIIFNVKYKKDGVNCLKLREISETINS